MRTCFQIYTVPGQVYYNSTRKLVLQGVDGVIFIADSSPNMMEENLESLRNLVENLEEYGRSFEDMPIVIQYNKRDIPGALSIEELEEKLNPSGAPAFEAIANTGQGVFPTLKAVAATVLDSLHRQQGGTSSAAPVPASAPDGEPMSLGEPQAAIPAGPQAVPVQSTSQPMEPSAPVASELPSPPTPARPTASMSQTGFHKAPSIPLESVPSASAVPAPAPVESPGLRMAQPATAQEQSTPVQALASQAPSSPQPVGGLQMKQAPMEAPAAAKPQVQVLRQTAPAPAAPAGVSSLMGVAKTVEAPARKATRSKSFPTPQQKSRPMATPGSAPQKSAAMTGVIVVVSIGLGALLGSFVLSIL
jgi:hypothetical protein